MSTDTISGIVFPSSRKAPDLAEKHVAVPSIPKVISRIMKYRKQNVGLPTLEFDRNTSKRTTTGRNFPDMVVLNSHYEFSLKHLSYITYYNESMPSKRFSRLQNEDLTKWSCY
ncbi:hypothetical protein RCL_jg26132.t3 [Rhizophagus clarus]|uniref:Uncharacterized protein n=1 Tax=Rhizophagus clarus TaxID=94130 RepID=A0A8H3QC08_9GLOM|nr:hypothetical protein RCL_jg26132.t3 [Rhizophagus clarus]